MALLNCKPLETHRRAIWRGQAWKEVCLVLFSFVSQCALVNIIRFFSLVVLIFWAEKVVEGPCIHSTSRAAADIDTSSITARGALEKEEIPVKLRSKSGQSLREFPILGTGLLESYMHTKKNSLIWELQDKFPTQISSYKSINSGLLS